MVSYVIIWFGLFRSKLYNDAILLCNLFNLAANQN